MKRDIKLILESGAFDIAIETGDLENEEGFDTAIWVSLFTDARAGETQVLSPENRRGWLGNTVSDIEERQLGGLLWLAEQRRLTQDTLNELIDYARKSLNWMVEDNIAQKVEVDGEIVPRNGMALSITITSREGITSSHYIPLWEVTGAN
ncbi:MAG: phage GP46 family protein [Candidatus Peribacteraceae bacterium]|nr:phage GP46 family protein [Candidatus Peribacteraceae bacterium]